MSEMSPAPIPAVEAPPVAAPTPSPGVTPGVCACCGQKLPTQSVFRKVARAARVVLHDPNVDRQGKALVAVLVVRLLAVVGASDGLVQAVRAALHVAGVNVG